MKLTYFLALAALLVPCIDGVSFIPAMDIMVYGTDGSLITIWGEHNFYQDTTSFGHPVTYSDGVLYLGAGNERNT